MDFQYYVPVKIISGTGCIRKNYEKFGLFGDSALIVTGKSSAQNGALDDVIYALKKNGMRFEVFDRVPNNPTVECVRNGVQRAKEIKATLIVGIGGGSPMDAAKSIAVFSRQPFPNNVFEYTITEDVLPMIHVPTTAGTGSEVTQYSILNYDEKQTKKSISALSMFPKIAFLDGSYTENLPQNVTVNTALDAVSHAVEGMLSVRANPISDSLACAALRVLTGEYSSLAEGEYSAESRQNLLFGATLAGMVIANTGTTPVHGMGYSLTYFHGVPHGRANGLLLPRFLSMCEQKIPQRMQEVYAAIGTDNAEFSKRVGQLLGNREIFSDEELRQYAYKASVNKNIKNCSAYFSEEDLYNVLKQSVGK